MACGINGSAWMAAWSDDILLTGRRRGDIFPHRLGGVGMSQETVNVMCLFCNDTTAR